MSITLSVELDGRQVPLRDFDWVLRGPCGCPFGVTVGANPYEAVMHATELAAWAAFYDSEQELDHARHRGEHVELMTHERYCAEVSARMLVRREHGRPA